MKIKFAATGRSPAQYEFSGETITADGEPFDLSGVEYGGRFLGVSVDTLALEPLHIIRDARRDEHGELWVTLCQTSPAGHWLESDWMDAEDYQPGVLYIREISTEQARDEIGGVFPWEA